jgi:RHS repeat-associated protein
MIQETLEWTPSGKLTTYHSPIKQKEFTYTPRGHLQTAGKEKYEFDLAGIRTNGPHHQVQSLDPFGRVLSEIIDKCSLTTTYNSMGQTTTQGQKHFEWDPWGRLLKVTDPQTTWEASYDALGRRLQTRYTASNKTQTTTSLYDPEEEFQEIGIQIDDKIFWKLYGPTTCDAIIDETGGAVFLTHNALSELLAITTEEETTYIAPTCTSYGPQTKPTLPTDLISYALSLSWHDKALDPTGLILMGARYYDPKTGRFISPDPLGYPLCINLYAYTDGDPINYSDLDGRFASKVYQKTPAVMIWNTCTSFYANHGICGSAPLQVGSYDLQNGAIGFINGINNTRSEFIESAYNLSQYAHNAKIYGIYNAKNFSGSIGKKLTGAFNSIVSIGTDIAECGLGRIGLHTPPVQLLKNQWAHFAMTYGPDAKFLQICHSGGADHVKNALISSSEATRQRIIVLAINPSVIIPRKLCFQSHNYMSRRDFVTSLDIIGRLRYGNELHILEPHPNAKFWDHEFASPTFTGTIKRHIKDYIEDYGGTK